MNLDGLEKKRKEKKGGNECILYTFYGTEQQPPAADIRLLYVASVIAFEWQHPPHTDRIVKKNGMEIERRRKKTISNLQWQPAP